MERLHVGCGRTPLPGWINLDCRPLPGVDLVADLDGRDAGTVAPLPLPDDSVEAFLLSHVLEHIREPLGMMQELWRADYGYRGDWHAQRLVLLLETDLYHRYQDGGPGPTLETLRAVQGGRNVVRELVAHLTAVKPARPPVRELVTHPPIEVLDARW